MSTTKYVLIVRTIKLILGMVLYKKPKRPETSSVKGPLEGIATSSVPGQGSWKGLLLQK